MTRRAWRTYLERALWGVAACLALWVIVDVGMTIAWRLNYPYDLDSMEGSTLHHAARIATGQGIYVAPSVAFIPNFATPLYPTLVGLLGSVTGINYSLARAISVAALLATLIGAWVHFRRFRLWHAVVPRLTSHSGAFATPAVTETSMRPELWLAALIVAAGYAAAYRAVGGWFDLARADSLFLCMVTLSCYVYVREPEEAPLPMRLVAVTALLTLSFFCQQAGAIYIVVLSALMLTTSPRRMWLMMPIAAALGLGFIWVLQGASGGWFWIYSFELPLQKGVDWTQIWQAFPAQILAVLPISLALMAGLLWSLWHVAKRAPRATAWWLSLAVAMNLATVAVDLRGLLASSLLTLIAGNLVMTQHADLGVRLYWRWLTIYGASLVIGALMSGTPRAGVNAYMPALLHGAIACGALLIAVLQRAQARPVRLLLIGATTVLCASLAVAHQPSASFVPTAHDRQANEALRSIIGNIEGEVWVPSHPWYGKLAGKQPWAHRRGILDIASVRRRPPLHVAALEAALRAHAFTALVLSDHDLHSDPATSQIVRANYKPVRNLALEHAVPSASDGPMAMPTSIWMPIERVTGTNDEPSGSVPPILDDVQPRP